MAVSKQQRATIVSTPFSLQLYRHVVRHTKTTDHGEHAGFDAAEDDPHWEDSSSDYLPDGSIL